MQVPFAELAFKEPSFVCGCHSSFNNAIMNAEQELVLSAHSQQGLRFDISDHDDMRTGARYYSISSMSSLTSVSSCACHLQVSILPQTKSMSIHDGGRLTFVIDRGYCPLDWTHFPSPSLTLGLPKARFEHDFQAAFKLESFCNQPDPTKRAPAEAAAIASILPFTRKELSAARRRSMLCWHPDKATTTNKLHPEAARIIARRIDTSYDWLDVRVACVLGEDVEDALGKVVTDTEARRLRCVELFAKTMGQLAGVISDEAGVPFDQNYVGPGVASSFDTILGLANLTIAGSQMYLPQFTRTCAPQSISQALYQVPLSIYHQWTRVMYDMGRHMERQFTLKRNARKWAAESKHKASQMKKQSWEQSREQSSKQSWEERVQSAKEEQRDMWQDLLGKDFWGE